MPNFKVGQELFWCYFDDETGKCELDTYKVRTIRGGVVFAILVFSGTWGKRSKKSGDFGWLDKIPSWCRKSCRQGEKFNSLHTTKRQAWQAELMSVRRWLNEKGEWALTDDQRLIHEKGVVTLKRMVKRYSKKINKKS